MITAESYLVGDFSMETPFSFGGCVPKAKNQDYVRDEYGVNEDELDQVEVRNDRASNEINTGWWRGSLNTRTI